VAQTSFHSTSHAPRPRRATSPDLADLLDVAEHRLDRVGPLGVGRSPSFGRKLALHDPSAEEIEQLWPRLVGVWPAYERFFARTQEVTILVLEVPASSQAWCNDRRRPAKLELAVGTFLSPYPGVVLVLVQAWSIVPLAGCRADLGEPHPLAMEATELSQLCIPLRSPPM
jgi:hypothetical protein